MVSWLSVFRVTRFTGCYRRDEVKGCVISAADKAVEDLIEWWDLDDEYEFPGMDTTKFKLDISTVTKVDDTVMVYELFGVGRRGGVNPYDAASVSTMVSRHAKGKTTKQKASGKSAAKEKPWQRQRQIKKK